MVILVGLNIAAMITNPLSGLVHAAIRVSQGDLKVRVEPQSHDEIEVLANSFNEMVSNLYRSKNELIEAYDSTLLGWSKALELRDHETEGHAKRVAELTQQLARHLGISEEDLIDINRGVLLHDIGKMGIPDSILLKPGPLSEEEWVLMRKHPQYAYDMLKDIDYLKKALEIPYCHHERWDGDGYPRRLKGEEIPLTARIFAIIDVYDALKSDRPYRQSWPEEDVLQYISQNSDKHFDPYIANAFINFTGRKDSND
jgi:HD-GYP domain-containing protein (c-di-GMP phosphodiesterase class II)